MLVLPIGSTVPPRARWVISARSVARASACLMVTTSASPNFLASVRLLMECCS